MARQLREKYTTIHPIIKLHFLGVLPIFLLLLVLRAWRVAGAVASRRLIRLWRKLATEE